MSIIVHSAQSVFFAVLILGVVLGAGVVSRKSHQPSPNGKRRGEE